MSNSVTPWTTARQASLSITNSWSLPKPKPIELVMPSNHLILCRPLLLLSISPSIRVFSNESVLHIRWPKYWSFSFNVSPSSEHSGLISFRMDWLDLLVVQGTLKSLLQHCTSAGILRFCTGSMFFPQHTAATLWNFLGQAPGLAGFWLPEQGLNWERGWRGHSAVKAWSPNHWSARKFLVDYFLTCCNFYFLKMKIYMGKGKETLY